MFFSQFQVYLLVFTGFILLSSGALENNSNHQQPGAFTRQISRIAMNIPLPIMKKLKEKRIKAVEDAVKSKENAEKRIQRYLSIFRETHSYTPIGHTEHNNVLKLSEHKHDVEANIRLHNLAGKLLRGSPHVSQAMKERADKLQTIPKNIETKMKEAEKKGVRKDNGREHTKAFNDNLRKHDSEIEKHNNIIRKNSIFLPRSQRKALLSSLP